MDSSNSTLSTNQRVLATLNRDGTRRWLRPRPSKGAFFTKRMFVGWTLIGIFTLIPYIKIGGMPAILLNIVDREFTFFGTTFLPTDTLLLMLFAISVLLIVFLVTAIWGRGWCGWGCPQTIYLECLYRPLERLIEGTWLRQMKLDSQGPDGRRFLRYFIFILPSCFLAHTFLAYFVGVDQLLQWIQKSPAEHPTAFIVMAIVTLAMYADFTYFREQVCMVACPYGRLQSVLLDRDSLIVGYDQQRGETRGKKRLVAVDGIERGDCIDCGNCVTTCPTGIDIREGLQMECIACTQCIDACDAVMDKMKRPKGLIRFSSQNELEGKKRRFIRPRVVAYSALLAVTSTLFVIILATKSSADVSVLRAEGDPYTINAAGEISNRIRVKITNREKVQRTYRIDIKDQEGRIISAQNPISIPPGGVETVAMFLIVPRDEFEFGEKSVTLIVKDDDSFHLEKPCRLLGPF